MSRSNESEPAHAPGRHWLCEIASASATRLCDLDGTVRAFREALAAAGFTVLGEQSHAFDGGGFTAVFLLSESHASIHTWPERGYAAVDVFTCGERDATPVLNALAEHLESRDVTTSAHRRRPNRDTV